MSSSRDVNSRPLRAHSSGRRRQAQPEKGAPRSTTREDTKRSIVASPPHFDASSLSPRACADQLARSGKAAAPRAITAGGSSASGRCVAQRPRRDADRGGSRSRCGSLRYATDGLLIPRGTTAAVPSAGRDAAAQEAASTAPAGCISSHVKSGTSGPSGGTGSDLKGQGGLPLDWARKSSTVGIGVHDGRN